MEQDKTHLLQEIRDIKKLLNPELLELHQKSLQEQESRLVDKQPFKRIKLEVNNSPDLCNSESSDEGIQLGNSSPKQENKQQLINQQLNGNLIQNVNKQSAVLTNNITTDAATKNGCTATLTNSINNQPKSNQLINGKTNELVIDSDDIDVLRVELVEVRKVLDRERKLRMKLEENIRDLEAQLYPSRIKEIAQQVQLKFQTTGVNLFHQSQIQDNETEAAISSVLIDPQHELVAQTVEIGAEIEAQDCTEFPLNQQTILTSSPHPNFNLNNSNLITLTSTAPSNATLPPTATFHIIQDLTNSTLIDSTNLTTNLTSNSVPTTMCVDVPKIREEVSNKILTSTAYLTATTVSSTNASTNKQTKSKNPTNKTDKNAQSKHKTSNSSINQQHLNTPNNKVTSSANKKQQQSSSSVTALPNQQSSTQTNQPDSKKDKQQKPSKLNQPAAIALPIDVPFIFDPTSSGNLEITTNKTLVPDTTTVTVQIIDGSNLSSIGKFENVPVSSTTTAGRNNNLDTILEAICHLEGDMFGNNETSKSNKDDLSNKAKTNLTDQNETIRQDLKNVSTRPGVIVSSSNT